MNSRYEHPIAYYWSSSISTWLALLGAVYVFMTHGCENQQHDLAIKQLDAELKNVDTRIARATELAEIQRRALEAAVKKAEVAARASEVRLNELQSKLAETEIKHKTTQSLAVKPVIRVRRNLGMREVQLALQFTNVGNEPVRIHDISVRALRGLAADDVQKAIAESVQRANGVWNRSDHHTPLATPSDDSLGTRSPLTSRPFGRNEKHNGTNAAIYLVAEDASHITWEEIASARQVRRKAQTLAPKEEFTELFDYIVLCDEVPQSVWFRMQILINDGLASPRRLEFNLPGLWQGDWSFEQRTSMSMRESSNQTFEWEPPLPLLPIVDSPAMD